MSLAFAAYCLLLCSCEFDGGREREIDGDVAAHLRAFDTPANVGRDARALERDGGAGGELRPAHLYIADLGRAAFVAHLAGERAARRTRDGERDGLHAQGR